MANLAQAIPLSERVPEPYWKRPAIWRGLILAALLTWLYLPVIVRLWQQWWSDPNFSHGFFVPFFSLFVLWQNRSGLTSIPREPSIWGLLIVVVSLCTLIIGILGAEVFLARTSLLLLVTGMTVSFLGWKMLRAVLFPLAFLM